VITWINVDNYIHLEKVTKSFLEGSLKRNVINQLNAHFGKGQFIAILGQSGSGKSTLLNLISGIDQVDEGHIWVGNTDITCLNERERTLFRRENIGFIFQFFNLIPTLNVLENVTLSLELKGMKAQKAVPIASLMLDSVGLGNRSAAYPDRLSGGEQQRVAIARALVSTPMLLLADEPTGNLDEETGGQILNLLIHLTRKSQSNLILVTHNHEAAKLADKIYTLRDGNLFS
jgi:putative ABC transport system ATP-binding protein